jgi:O-antigen ligase
MRQLFITLSVFLLAVLGYLQPFHSLPWTSAVNCALFMLLGLVLALGIIAASRHTVLAYSWPELVVVSLVVLQAVATFNPNNHKSIVLTALVLGITYLCIKLPLGKAHVGEVLTFAIFCAGLVSAIFGIGLWLGAAQQFTSYPMWMTPNLAAAPLKSSLAQPNHAGTLLVWALAVATLYAHQLDRSLKQPRLQQVGQGALLASALLIASAIVLTNSRTAILNLALLLVVAVVYRLHLGNKAVRLVLVSVAVAVLVALFLPDLKQWLFELEPGAVLGGKTLNDNPRRIVYTTFVHALQAHWLAGYGIGGVTTAYLEHLSARPPLHTYFGEVHNLPLEILVCLGVPLGLGVLALLVRALVRAGKNADNVRDGIWLFMVAAVLVHAMLEYPLHYAYFLLPAAIFVKLLQPEHVGRTIRVAWYWLALVWLGLAVLMYSLTSSYLAVEHDMRQARLEFGLLGKARPAKEDYTNAIRELEALNVAVRADIVAGVTPKELQAYQLALQVYPTQQLVKNYIRIAQAKGDKAEVELWTKRLALLYGDVP